MMTTPCTVLRMPSTELQQVEQREDRLERERAEHCGGHGALAAAEHRAAEDDGGDGPELEAGAGLVGDAGDAGEEDPGDRRSTRRR